MRSILATLLLAITCAVLNIGTGLYIVLATPGQNSTAGDTAFWAVSIAACIFYCLSAILDLSVWVRPLSHRKACKVGVILFGLAALGGAGTVLGRVQLSAQAHGKFGARFCSAASGDECSWTGDRALLMAFVLWLATGILQGIYTAILLTRGLNMTTKQPLRTPMRFGIGSGDNSVSTETPLPRAQAESPSLALQEKRAPFRYPLNRKETEDTDAFTLDKVLAVHEGSSISFSEKSSGADRPGSHHASSSSAGWLNHHQSRSSGGSSRPPGSVRFHSTKLSNAQSWTSSRPNIASGLSPLPGRGKKGNAVASPDSGLLTPQPKASTTTAGTPESRRHSSAWETLGLALGSPSKAIGVLQSQWNNTRGSHTAQSSMSSGRSKTSKTLSLGRRFHLPKQSISGLDIPAVPNHTGETPELNMSPITMSTYLADGITITGSPELAEPTSSQPGSPVRIAHTAFSSVDLSPQTKPLRPRLKNAQMKYVPDLKMKASGRSATLPVAIGEPEELSSAGLARTQTAGLQTSPSSMQRKRSSILDSLKPRLPEGRSLSRTSWQIGNAGTRQQSPTRGGRRHSRQMSPTRHNPSQTGNPAGARRMSDADLAFSEWDTSHVETDPAYLVDMRDSRDISGSLASPLNSPIVLEDAPTPRSGNLVLSRGGFFQSPAMNMPMSPGLFDGSGRDEDPWQGRDIRVRSDGSIMHKEMASETRARQLAPPAEVQTFAMRSQSMQNFGLGLSSQGISARRFSQAPTGPAVVDVRRVVEAAGIRVSSIAAPEQRLH